MNSFFETLKQLGPARLGIMSAVILGLVLFFIFVSVRITVPEMKLLYGDLSAVDSGAIATKLQEANIDFDISQDGTKIIAPEDQISRARMILAAAGLPNGGSLGYELFDEQSSFGTTNFVQNINQVRALEGELARTIMSLEVVRSARIHLVLPQRELFSRDKRQASASVFLGIHPGAQIEREQVVAIQSLVASAVPDLKTKNVSIIDSNGNLLIKGGETGASLLSMKAEEMRRDYETRLTSKIEDQISRIVGHGKVRATVTAEVNFDRTSTNEELFDPEGQVIRSSQLTEESSKETDAANNDNVSIDNNLPGVGGDLLGGQGPSSENARLEEVTNYEISKTIRNTVRETGEIKSLSIAVLVDGTYTVDSEGVETYVPRSQDDLDQIEALVRSATGFNEDRGDLLEVINLQFAKVDTNEAFVDSYQILGFNKDKLLEFAEILTVMVMILLVIILVLQPMINKLLASVEHTPEEDLEAELLAAAPVSPALAAPQQSEASSAIDESLVNIHGVEGKVKASTVKKVEEIIDNYPLETISVIRSWMTQEGS